MYRRSASSIPVRSFLQWRKLFAVFVVLSSCLFWGFFCIISNSFSEKKNSAKKRLFGESGSALTRCCWVTTSPIAEVKGGASAAAPQLTHSALLKRSAGRWGTTRGGEVNPSKLQGNQGEKNTAAQKLCKGGVRYIKAKRRPQRARQKVTLKNSQQLAAAVQGC